MTNELLTYNYLMDLKKKEIDPVARATIITDYLKATNKSQRQLAKDIGMPYSTIRDWCLFSKVTKEEYDNIKSTGLTDTDIYRELRNNSCKSKKDLFKFNKIQLELNEAIKNLDGCKREVDNTATTKELIVKLQNILNIMLMYNEKKAKV